MNGDIQYKRLLPFQVLFTPIFKRFVIAVSQIDTTGAPKFEEVMYQRSGKIPVVQDIICQTTQNNYESKMFFRAFLSATKGYGFNNRSKAPMGYLNDFLNSLDKNILLQAADVMCQQYYQCILPKLTTCPRALGEISTEESQFSIMTIGDLAQKVDELEGDFNVHNAFSILKSLINENKLLPIDNFKVLAISKVKGSESEEFEFKIIILVCFIAYVFLLWNVPNPPWGRA